MSKSVKVYTKNACPSCVATKNILDRDGIEYELINVEEDEKAFAYVKDELGLTSMPVVVAEGQEPFAGFRPDLLEKLK